MQGFISKPFSQNIIFLDTEFSTDDPDTSELLSIGMVKMSGQEIYLELDHQGEVSDWVRKKVVPFLKGNVVSKEEAIRKIRNFVDGEELYPMAFVNVYDMVYLYRLFGATDKAPFKWPPLDFASILFANRIDPESYYRDEKNNFFDEIGIDADKFDEHNALDDAKLMREVYLKLTS